MSYQRERDEFIAAMVREGMPVDTARLILRHANTVQRLAVEACNRQLTLAEERRDGYATARIIALVQECNSQGNSWLVNFTGDPRGYCVKIRVPSGRTADFGGYGIGVPTRRY
jgi:hypothetical protein